MYVLIQKTYDRVEGNDVIVLGTYDDKDRANRSMINLGKTVGIDDGIEYDVLSVPFNMDYEEDQ